MFTIDQYVKVQSLSEAYELAQKKTATILGGCGWLKMGRRPIQTAIDLSGLGLDQIQETDGYFELGCLATLRQIETSKALAACFGDCIAECLRHIVGVQFRNCATIGGSIWGRFGFSDPLTLFLALDAEVCLYRGGMIPLRDFVRMDYDRDVLAAVRLPKRGQKAVYLTHRASATDFPVLACAVCRFPAGSGGNGFRAAVGARPQRAALISDSDGILDAGVTAHSAAAFADWAAAQFTYASNMRGSAEFRRHLTRVLIKRALLALEV